MEDRDFRVGDKVTCKRYGWGEVVCVDNDKPYNIEVGLVSKNDDEFKRIEDYTSSGRLSKGDKYRSLFHGHLDLDDIQKYIESKEQKPERKVTKYLNMFKRRDNDEIIYHVYTSKDAALENARVGKSGGFKYHCTAQPIEVTE